MTPPLALEGIETNDAEFMQIELKNWKSTTRLAWGHAPVPLIPRALRRLEAERPAPRSLRAAFGGELTLADLDQGFWLRCADIDAQCLRDIVRIVGPLLSRHAAQCAVDPAAPAFTDIDSVPLSPRTASLLRNALDSGRIALGDLSFGALLALPYVGIKRVLEFTCVLEAVNEPLNLEFAGVTHIDRFFSQLADWTVRELEHATLEQVLPSPNKEWPQSIACLWQAIRTSEIGPRDSEVGQSDSVPGQVARAIAQCDALTMTILRARVLAISEPTRLEVLSAALGETPTRILELERKGLEALERCHGESFASLLQRAEEIGRHFGAAIPFDDESVTSVLKQVVSDFEESDDHEIAIELLLWFAGPYRKHDGWLLSGANLVGRTAEALLDCRRSSEEDSLAGIYAALTQIGVRAEYHGQWLAWVSDVARLVELDRVEPIAVGNAPVLFAVK